jgi:hypothetical protein
MKSQMNKKRKGIVDLDTGQLETTLDKYEQDQKDEKIKNKYKWNKNGSKFTFARMEATKEVVQVLGHSQLAYLMLLNTYIGYGDNIIRNTDKSPMKTSEMIKILGISSKDTFYNFLNACQDNNIIIKNDDGSYSINSEYHFKGKNKGDNKVVQVHNTEIRNAYNSMKPATLGLFYLLLPYIHLETNTLCYNSYEEDVTKLQKLNRKQLCELIGIDTSTFSKKILKATFDGKAILAEVKVLGSRSYLINPWIFYRLQNAPNDELIKKEVDPLYPDKTLRSIFSV